MRCANCAIDITYASCTGSSSIYNPGTRGFLLCEPCYLDEDDEIEAEGTNVNPRRIELYTHNQPEGANRRG